MGIRYGIIALAAMVAAPGIPVAQAREVTLRVDSHAVPWHIGANPKMSFGLGDGRPPAILMGMNLPAGGTLQITAKGMTTTVQGGGPIGPDGMLDWIADRGTTWFPSRYIDTRKRPVHLNELVGCFVDADGACIGKPFAIGAKAALVVPSGASGLSMGINDDRFADNTGELIVTISIPEPKVTVEKIDE